MHNLKLQPDKCEFLRKEVTYLGHKITASGLCPDPEKIAVVKKFPTPTNTRVVQQYLGLCSYYRKFIPKFNKISKPLTNLLRKNVPFKWDQKTEEAFSTLKEILTTGSLLQYPDFSKPFVLSTDASSEAFGAILNQGPIGQDLPIAYASRTQYCREKIFSHRERTASYSVGLQAVPTIYVW